MIQGIRVSGAVTLTEVTTVVSLGYCSDTQLVLSDDLLIFSLEGRGCDNIQAFVTICLELPTLLTSRAEKKGS